MQQTFVRRHYRTVFLSDLHLGLRASRADLLLDFLGGMDCGRIVLVGDIVDGWRLRKSWYWDAHHDEVIRLLLRKAREGVEILYIPGNHDEMFRDWVGLEVAGIHLVQQAEHVTADGRRLLVMHGDEFDSVVRYWPLLAHLGDWAYDAALLLNRWFNTARRRMGYPYWSLSQWLKRRVKEAVKAIDRFEESLAHEALRGGYDGVICGHIHHAEMRDIGGVTYMNTGDWVESCTALVEHPDGRFELLDWSRRSPPVPRPVAPAAGTPVPAFPVPAFPIAGPPGVAGEAGA
ncbi:UDP-2,3-diacylglucosamine hydrolase (plasmid) [Roseomonas mucosa]|uniref:UDP-2,3-diacylglucosamine hydrolase n=5 Tax=Roseomonadaceae TaxID=3385906 RepID=A0A379PMK9_9PROT|nr:UDP-2,3-diacylglucosamine diphosphatase [Roseomonas mucosa]MCG7355851.1 UDP-2,3-diacylglucosamine diphosphatase [Roseomonas mucosa]MDT8315552.1 UDP-2,3-diacylglucosamine diphosphatase [Roseomonas mucosa]QDD92599.1 UDP-2,3-diacylglucosamine hydrolase [Roseomonas mucosa]QDD97709.1 UDP-2,3-diacylglucosamine hydrolase [Roseomonas mucosa]QET91797.1 UDP-2,3-diacylglucosamine diphosphatase [Roseomonas mucosa]